MEKEYKNITVMYKMIGLVVPLLGYMFIAVVTGVLGFLCAILIPVSATIFIVQQLNLVHWFTPTSILIFMVIIALLRGILHYIEQACNHYIAFKLLAILRDKIFRKLRQLSPAKLEGRDKGNLISLITSDIELLEVFYAHTISPLLIAIVTCAILLYVFLRIHPAYFVIALVAYLCVGVVIPLQISKKGREIGDKCRKSMGELSTTTLESIRGLNMILQYNQGEHRLNKMYCQSNDVNALQKVLKKIEGIGVSYSSFAIHFFSILMALFGIKLYYNGVIGFEMVIIPTVLLFSSFGPVIALANVSNNLLLTLASGRRVIQLLEENPIVEDVSSDDYIKAGDIKMNHIHFSYDKELIIDNVNEVITKGKITGIYGKSGSGKSTLLKLLMRFYDVTSGSITINEKNISTIDTNNLRQLESFVTQDAVLFHDSILNNIKIGKLDATEDEVINACKKANIHDFICSLDQGYHTSIEELGDSLSGGQKQRLSLARAFLHDGQYILLDEPTSNLDILNESWILKSLQELTDKTVILVSHRQSTMGICNKVIEMNKGRVS